MTSITSKVKFRQRVIRYSEKHDCTTTVHCCFEKCLEKIVVF